MTPAQPTPTRLPMRWRALVPGLRLYFKAAHANTAASTLAVNGGAAKAITKPWTPRLSPAG